MADIYNLERFKQAQDLGVYDKALEEVQNGRKTGHWIWFIFPQMRGFGSSYNSHFYGITCAEGLSRRPRLRRQTQSNRTSFSQYIPVPL